MKSLTIIIAGILGLVTFTSFAGEKSLPITSSNILISGTTNIGSWNCSQNQAEGKIKFIENEDGRDIKNLNLNIPVNEFSNCKPPAGPSSGQERAVHKYLKAEDHPNATFVLKRTHPQAVKNEAFFYGVLTIAGVSNNIRANVSINNTGEKLKISGIQKLNMTDFEIDPPTGLFGTIRARDEVEVEFEIIF